MPNPDAAMSNNGRFVDWGREHGAAVRGYLMAMVRRADLADDLTQEVFFKAWQARDRYREQGAARAYLLRIADRLVCDLHRKRKRRAPTVRVIPHKPKMVRVVPHKYLKRLN